MGVKPKLVVTGPESARSVTNGLEAVKQSGERGLVVSCARRAASERDGEVAGMVSVLAEPPR